MRRSRTPWTECRRARWESGRHVEVPDPSRGEVWDSGCGCGASLFEGPVATPDLFPSRRWDRGHTCDEVESGQPEWAE
jgi:hypothetical protein